MIKTFLKTFFCLFTVIYLTNCQGPRKWNTDVTPNPTNVISQKPPDFTYKYTHGLTEHESKIAAESLAKSLEKYGLRWRGENSQIFFNIFKGILKGTNGYLILTPSSVEVKIYDLPKFLPNKLVELKVDDKIKKYFKPVGKYD